MKNKINLKKEDLNINSIVNKIYKNIFKLDTKTLESHEIEVFKELISRKDYNELDFLIDKYYILRDELISRGVEL